jgi:hypothetical protein
MASVTADAAAIRRFAGLALVAGLCVAAGAAVLALLTGSFSDEDTRVILSSIGFAVASATASSGAAARLRPSVRLQMLGSATVLASVAAFVLLLVGLWTNIDEWGSEGVWRACGCIGTLGIAGAHACLVLGGLRSRDTEAIRLVALSSIGFSAFDTFAVLVPLLDLVDDIDEPWPNVFGATLILLVLTSVLPPILRRMQPAAPQAAQSSNGSVDRGDEFFATAVIRIADRIDVLNGDPGNRAPEIRAELDRLRKLAQSFEN